MHFRLEGDKIGLSIAHDQIAMMVSYVAISEPNETGGVLMGYYTDDMTCAVVTEVVGPPKDSKSGRTWFKRGVHGLKDLFKKAWEKKQYYLGEWHFHPYGTTEPSAQDYYQMLEIAESTRYACPEAIMIIIAGRSTHFTIQPYLTLRKQRTTYLMTRAD